VETVLASVLAKVTGLADVVSDCWFVLQPQVTDSACFNLLNIVPQNIMTTECGDELVSNSVFIIKYVVLCVMCMAAEAMKGVQVFVS
jgi:hypothetical protein